MAATTLKTTYTTIKGFEAMRALCRGQASIFNITRAMRGEARFVKRASGLRPSALAEPMQLVTEQLELQAA